VGPLPPSNGFKYILTVIDRFSRWFTATPLKEITTEATIEALMNGWIQHFGCPVSVVTDQGGQFTGNVWKQFMSVLGIKHVTTTSYHPQSNGLVENLHRRLKDALRMQKFPNRWHLNLPVVALVIRTTMKEDYPCSPAELVYGQDLRLPGEFKVSNVPTIASRDSLVNNLKEFISEIKPVPPRVHLEVPSYLDKQLQHCKMVLVRKG